MHPAGIEFGLSRGLLELRGDEVLFADRLLEEISLEAQAWLQLKKSPIDGNFLVDLTIRSADKLLAGDRGTSSEIAPFFAGLNRIMYYTLCRVAERAGVAEKKPDRLLTNQEVWGEFCTRAAYLKLKPGRIQGRPAKLLRPLFKICHQIVKDRYPRNDPDNARHTDLVALFMF